ncbi:tetratricopeptide repeat protein, partial [Balneolaceae bacterium ANBcel3]|nr:tetratricopeptide repeat protein [Balneolaceae bacterium ANBcel3]
RFDAWKPFRNDLSKKDPVTPVSKKHYNLDLDLLIEQLSKAEKKKIELSEEEALKEDKGNNEAPSQSIEDIASETLAAIYEKQKRYEEALDMYGKLLKAKPENTERYQQKISDLKTLIDSEATDTGDPS